MKRFVKYFDQQLPLLLAGPDLLGVRVIFLLAVLRMDEPYLFILFGGLVLSIIQAAQLWPLRRASGAILRGKIA